MSGPGTLPICLYIDPNDLDMKKTNLILFAVAAFAISACTGNKSNDTSSFVKAEGMVWNTSYHVTYRGPETLRDSIIGVLDSIGTSLNVFDENSLVSRVNRQDTTPVNNDFIQVYTTSLRINRLTDGAFDPTLGPLIKAWGFGPGHKASADTARIDSILPYCNIATTRLSMDALIKEDTRTQFNFSAIAKGYGCDMIGKMLERNGVQDWLVEIGGEIAANGSSPTGEQWRVSIDKPLLQSDSIIHDSQAIIQFTDMGMATSGNYRNFRTEGGKTFGHTISSQTGRPIATDVISATVLARTSMEADALATAFMAVGSQKVQELNKSLRLPVMLILTDSTTWTSPQMEKLMVKTPL